MSKLEMNPVRTWRTIVVSLIGFVGASLPASAEDQLTLLLDWFVNPNHAPIVIAQENGYFAAQNLSVRMVPPADPSAPPRLVAAGQADLAVSYQPQLHLQVDQGLPLVRVGTLISTPLNCLLTLLDGAIQSPGDLRGKRIGFSVSGVEEAVLDTVLNEHGLGIGDVELINVNFALSPALMSGQVDAVVGAFRNFELNQMDIEGVAGRCFYLEQHGVPAYDELIYVANSETLDASLISRFLDAIEQATHFIINNPEASWELFAATAPELNDELNARAWMDTLPRFALSPRAVDVRRYSRFEDFLVQRGVIQQAKPVSALAIDLGRLE